MSDQLSSHSQGLVFASDNGKPCNFFVEASAVRERPKLVRRINKNGGSVVNTPRDADILLAENNTKEALEILDAWSGDKVVLSTRWVAHCLDTRTFLGADYAWAGLELSRQALYEGIERHDDDNDAEEDDEVPVKKPKTSRSTHASSQSSKPTASKQSRNSEPGPSRPRISNASSSDKTRKPHFSQAAHTSEIRHPDHGEKHHTQSVQSPSEDSLRLTTGSKSPVDNAAPPSFSSSTLLRQQAAISAMWDSLLRPLQQHHTPDMFSSIGQFPNFPQSGPLTEPLLPPNYQQLAQQLALNPQFREAFDQVGSGTPGQYQQASPGVPASVHSTQESSTRPTPEDIDADVISEASSVRLEEREVELSISRRHKGKGRATDDISSDGDVQTAIRSKPPRSKENVEGGKDGIFVDNQGMPKQFYVMVDLKNRKDLLKIIRKHNGAMVSQMDDADYIILNNRSNQFQKALNLLPVHKIALAPTWVEDCDIMGKMVEMAPHVIDVTSGVGQGAARRKPTGKGRQPKQEVAECESEESDSEQVDMPMAKPTPDKTRITPQDRDEISPQPRSRSPSPPSSVKSRIAGRNLFTDDDRLWFIKYARFKLERNPYMSQSALIREVGRKAPHHPARSWDNTWRSKWFDELNALKEEIATLRQRTHISMPSTSSAPPPASRLSPPRTQEPRNPSSSGHTLGELMYPDSPSSPLQSPSGHPLPPNSAPVSSESTSTQTYSQYTSPWDSFKRKEKPNETQVDVEELGRQGKRIKAGPEEVIDVDSYPDLWSKTI